MIELNGSVQVFFGGVLGPFLVELVKLAAWRDRPTISLKYRKATYWIGTLALFLVGGIVTLAQGSEHVPLLRACELGAVAPLIVGGWATASTTRHRRRELEMVGGMPKEKAGAISQLANLLSW
jgi:hypothetical protein